MPKDLKLNMVTYPKFADLIRVSEFESNLKKIIKKASSSYAVIMIWFGVILIWKNAPSMLLKQPMRTFFINIVPLLTSTCKWIQSKGCCTSQYMFDSLYVCYKHEWKKKASISPESDAGGADAVRAGQTFEFLAGKIVQLAKNGN